LVEMHSFNDAGSSNQSYFYIKQRRVKTEWGVGKSEGEREREEQIKGVGDGA
jgi:hypothetical protein